MNDVQFIMLVCSAFVTGIAVGILGCVVRDAK